MDRHTRHAVKGLVLGILLVAYFAFAMAYVYSYGTGIGSAFGLVDGHIGSPAYFGNNVSYLDGSNPHDSQLWVCDNSTDGWRERAEAQMDGSGDDIFARDPDGYGGSCGRRDTSRSWDKHRMWGGRDENPGAWSNHN